MSSIYRARHDPSTGPVSRRALTLVEMLIAMALTLILVYAIAEFYARIGPAVKDGRAMIDLVAQLRTATARLRADLELITVPMGVFSDDGSAMGYFEVCEGGNVLSTFVCSDIDANGNNLLDILNPPLPGAEDANANGTNDFAENNVTTMYGDTDDILAFTIRSDGAPFVGKACVAGSNPPSYFNISSNLAEVAWFTSFSDKNGNGTRDIGEPQFLNRRLLLVIPGTTPAPGLPNNGAANIDYFQYNDVSAHLTPAGYLPNTFVNLSRRENRFAHLGRVPASSNFPNQLLLNPFDSTTLTKYTLQNENLGEDRFLANLLAFDVRVFDPYAPIRADGDTSGSAPTTDDAQGTVQPGDPGYLTAIMNSGNYSVVGYGAYVDVGYGHQLFDQLVAQGVDATTAGTVLNTVLGQSQFDFQSAYLAQIGRTYDTWALSYERDGDNQNGNGLTDEGTNGFDDDNSSGVDDPGERETSPPYAVPLRGIQVKLRVYEPTTRQVRQATIGWDFISE